MKRYLLALSGICLSLSVAFAQKETNTYETMPTDSISEEVGWIPESLDANVDSLLNTWHIQYFTKKDDFCEDSEFNVSFGLCRPAETPASHYTDDVQSGGAELYRTLCRQTQGIGTIHVGNGRLLFSADRTKAGCLRIAVGT